MLIGWTLILTDWAHVAPYLFGLSLSFYGCAFFIILISLLISIYQYYLRVPFITACRGWRHPPASVTCEAEGTRYQWSPGSWEGGDLIETSGRGPRWPPWVRWVHETGTALYCNTLSHNYCLRIMLHKTLKLILPWYQMDAMLHISIIGLCLNN